MGLPLYNPSETIPHLSELEPAPDEVGILTRRLAGPTPSPKHRHLHRHRHRNTPPRVSPLGDYHPSALKRVPGPSRRDHSYTRRSSPIPKSPRDIDDLDLDTREGRDLARSSLGLPRRPSLEREEAFCGDRPAKKRRPSYGNDDGAGPDASDETAQELYRLGLLYDNPHERGERFTFAAIVHDEPLYSVRAVRPRKRRRKARAAERPDGIAGTRRYAGLPPLELSFAALADDERLAAFLAAPGRDELVGPAETEAPARAVVRSLSGIPEGVVDARGEAVVVCEQLDMRDVPGGGPGTTQKRAAGTEPSSITALHELAEFVSDSDSGFDHGELEELEWEVLNPNADERNGDGGAGCETWVVLG